MKLQFEAHQDYQFDAIYAVVGLFYRQLDASQNAVPMADEGLSSLKLCESGGNQRMIPDEHWPTNLQALQSAYGMAKPYVYLRTVHELSEVGYCVQ